MADWPAGFHFICSTWPATDLYSRSIQRHGLMVSSNCFYAAVHKLKPTPPTAASVTWTLSLCNRQGQSKTAEKDWGWGSSYSTCRRRSHSCLIQPKPTQNEKVNSLKLHIKLLIFLTDWMFLLKIHIGSCSPLLIVHFIIIHKLVFSFQSASYSLTPFVRMTQPKV